MPVIYRVHKFYTCELTTTQCGESDTLSPECKKCDIYQDFKKGIKTKKPKFGEDDY